MKETERRRETLNVSTSGEKRSGGPAKHVSDGCWGMSDTRGRLHVGLGGKCG